MILLSRFFFFSFFINYALAQTALVDKTTSSKKNLTQEQKTKLLKKSLGLSVESEPPESPTEAGSSVSKLKKAEVISQPLPSVRPSFSNGAKKSGLPSSTKRPSNQQAPSNKLDSDIFDKTNIQTTKTSNKIKPQLTMPTPSFPQRSAPMFFPASPSAPLPLTPSPVLPTAAVTPSSPPQKLPVESAQPRVASEPVPSQNQEPTNAPGNCLKACENYTQALKKDFGVKSIKKVSGQIVLETSSTAWTDRHDPRGNTLSSTSLSDVFSNKCKHIHKGQISSSNRTLYHIDFSDTEEAQQCEARFASILRNSYPGENISKEEEDRLNGPPLGTPVQSASTRQSGPRPVLLLDNNGQHRRVNGSGLGPVTEDLGQDQSGCQNACIELVEAYKNGNLAVKGIVSDADAFSFSIEAKDNFDWKQNSPDTNPNFEEHENFVKLCSPKLAIGLDTSRPSRLNISFKGSSICQRKFKLAAAPSSSPSRETARSTSSSDPFAAPVDTSTNVGRSTAQAATSSSASIPSEAHPR